MVAEEVEEAVVCGRWVAGDAGGDGLVAQSVQATRRLAVGNEQVIEVGLAFGHAETTSLIQCRKPLFHIPRFHLQPIWRKTTNFWPC